MAKLTVGQYIRCINEFALFMLFPIFGMFVSEINDSATLQFIVEKRIKQYLSKIIANMLNTFAYLLLIAVSYIVAAQKAEDVVYRHPLTDMPPSAEDVETSPYFPEHTDHKFPIGETVTSLCHFINDGSTNYNVSAVMGSLNSPFEFSHHFQNYSYKTFGTIVKPGEEITFKYNFQLHKELEPVDYQLAITVFYESEQHSFSTTFFNQVALH